MKKLMTAMLALSFLGATAMYAQVPAKKDTTVAATKKAPKKTTEKKDTTAAKTKAPKTPKAKKTTEKK